MYLFYKTALNLPFQSGLFSTRVSFHVISWSIYMTDTVMHAVESLGVHCSWTPPVVGVCYLNPWSRVPCLPFSWVLIADPDWCSPHTNYAVKFSHLALSFFKVSIHMWLYLCTCVCVCACKWCYLRPYFKQAHSKIAMHK